MIKLTASFDHVSSHTSSLPIADWLSIGQILDKSPNKIKVFVSQKPDEFANAQNPHYETTPTVLDGNNVHWVLQRDITPISFIEGHCRNDNFQGVHCFIMDIDNSGLRSEIQEVTMKDVHEELCRLNINHLIVSSKSDGIQKCEKKDKKTKEIIDDGNPRERFHAFFPLDNVLCDRKYEALIIWACDRFKCDPNAFLKSQKIFGFGNHTSPRALIYMEGKNVDRFVGLNHAKLDHLEYGSYRDQFKSLS